MDLAQEPGQRGCGLRHNHPQTQPQLREPAAKMIRKIFATVNVAAIYPGRRTVTFFDWCRYRCACGQIPRV